LFRWIPTLLEEDVPLFRTIIISQTGLVTIDIENGFTFGALLHEEVVPAPAAASLRFP